MKRSSKVPQQESNQDVQEKVPSDETSQTPKKKKRDINEYIRDLPDPPEGWHLHGGFYDFE